MDDPPITGARSRVIRLAYIIVGLGFICYAAGGVQAYNRVGSPRIVLIIALVGTAGLALLGIGIFASSKRFK
jgi:hypothetical protein